MEVQQVSSQEFKREMTSVFLEVKKEFLQGKLEKCIAEFSAALPSQPKTSLDPCVLTKRQPKLLSLKKAALPEEAPKPLSPVPEGSLTKVTLPGQARKPSILPLVLPANRSVEIRTAKIEKKEESLSLQCAEKCPLPKPVQREDPKPLTLSQPSRIVIQQPDPAQTKTSPLKLQILFHMTTPKPIAVPETAPLILPVQRQIHLRHPSNSIGDVSVKTPALPSVPLEKVEPKTSPQESLPRIEAQRVSLLSPVDARKLEPIQPSLPDPDRSWFARKPSIPLSGTPLILPAQRQVHLRHPFNSIGDVSVKAPTLSSVPLEKVEPKTSPQESLPRIEAQRVSPLPLVKEWKLEPIQPSPPDPDRSWFARKPSIPSSGTPLVLPAQRQVHLKHPSNSIGDISVKTPALSSVPLEKVEPKTSPQGSLPRIEAQRILPLPPVKEWKLEPIQSPLLEPDRSWFDCRPPTQLAEMGNLLLWESSPMNLPTPPDFMKLWEELDGPVVLIADFGLPL